MYELKKKTQAKAQKYIEQANKLVTEGLVNEKIEIFELTCMVLSNMIKNCQEQATSLRQLIAHVLMQKKPVDIQAFLNELNTMANKNQQVETFYFLATSNIDVKSLPTDTFEVNKEKIQFMPFGVAEKEFSISSLFKEWNLFTQQEYAEFLEYSYICIETSGYTPQDAYKNAFKTFELFRGIINFADDFKNTSTHFYGGIPKPEVLSIMEPAKVQMIFNKEKKHLLDWFTIGFFDYSQKRFNKHRNKFLDVLLKKINSLEDTSLKDRCLDNFRKYNNGMDGNIAGTSFLEFWKILEQVAVADLEEQGMAETKVAHRIASFFKGEIERDVVTALCDKRNFIRIRGIFQT